MKKGYNLLGLRRDITAVIILIADILISSNKINRVYETQKYKWNLGLQASVKCIYICYNPVK